MNYREECKRSNSKFDFSGEVSEVGRMELSVDEEVESTLSPFVDGCTQIDFE